MGTKEHYTHIYSYCHWCVCSVERLAFLVALPNFGIILLNKFAGGVERRLQYDTNYTQI